MDKGLLCDGFAKEKFHLPKDGTEHLIFPFVRSDCYRCCHELPVSGDDIAKPNYVESELRNNGIITLGLTLEYFGLFYRKGG